MKTYLKSGFSLIELMIVMLIASIMFYMVLPGLGRISTDVNLNSIQQQLILELTYTRSEAINRGGFIAICASTDGNGCSATFTSWTEGWIIFSDQNGNGTRDATEELIRVNNLTSNAVLTWSRGNAITFMGDGTATAASTGDFRICPGNGDATPAYGVTLNQTGRVRANNTAICP